MSIRLLPAACAAAALSLCAGMPASAHVTLETPQAVAGSGAKVVFRIVHGCAGAATTRIAVQLPREILTARPQPKPGWALAIRTERLPQPVPGPHGSTIEEAVVEIAWSGGPLPDAFYDEFAIFLRLPPSETERLLHLPVVQDCERGAHRWTGLPPGTAGADPGATGPAPSLRLLPRD